MDSKVELITHLVANTSSQLYFAARIAVTLAAGIPASTTDTPVTRGSRCSSAQTAQTKNGTRNSRTKA